MSKKPKRRRRGRPSKGPSVSVTFRLSKPLADRIDVLRKRVKRELTRTRALERLIQKGLEHDEEILRSIE